MGGDIIEEIKQAIRTSVKSKIAALPTIELSNYHMEVDKVEHIYIKFSENAVDLQKLHLGEIQEINVSGSALVYERRDGDSRTSGFEFQIRPCKIRLEGNLVTADIIGFLPTKKA